MGGRGFGEIMRAPTDAEVVRLSFRQSFEGRACDAVVRFIERREGAQRSNGRSPERARHSAPIELACEIGGRTYALEHTAVEPFTGQIAYDARFDRQMLPIADRLTPHVPDDERLDITIVADAMAGLGSGEVAKAHDAVVAAILKAMDRIPVLPWLTMQHWPTYIGVENGAPFLVSVRRSKRHDYSRDFTQGAIITRGVKDLEAARELRMAKACNDKFGKLAAWRATGATTVLVLESNDGILTSPELVAKAYLDAERQQTNTPDEVYFVWTPEDLRWYLAAIKVGARDYADLWNDGSNLIEVDPAELLNVTGDAA